MDGRKILFVITKGGWGGAQAYVYTLATAFSKEGAEVVVAVGGTGKVGLLVTRLTQAGIKVVPVPSLTRDVSFGTEWKALKELRTIIRTERPDVLHLNSSKAAGLGALAGKLERTPRIVTTIHGWPYKEPGSYRRSTFIWLASLVIVLLSHAVIVVAGVDKKTILGSFKKVRHIPLGIEGIQVKERAEARTFLLGDSSDPLSVLGTIAELTDNKGLEYGIRAFANLKQRGFAHKYVIIGDGELKETLGVLAHELGVKNDVVFAGFIPDAAAYLSAFDVFLFPSLKEGLPYALIEARTAGCRIVASNIGGIPEILKSYPNGSVVPPRNPDAIAQETIRLMKQEPREGAAYSFPPEEMIAQTRALY